MKLTLERSILLSAIILSASILMHGGIIKIGKPVAKTAVNQQQTAPTQPNQPQQNQPNPVPTQPQQPTINLAAIKNAFAKSLIKFGETDNKLIVVEVADPSCPFCQVAAGKNSDLNKQMGSQFTLAADGGTYVAPVPEIQQLVTEGKASFAWIYTPGHGNGEMGTKALYCAFEKGKFWEVHDLLMSSKGYDLLNNTVKNDKTKSQDMADFLASVFDPAGMKACLDSGKYDNRLKDEVTIAQSIGISGTPGFYFNENSFKGAYSYKDIEPTVKKILGL